MRISEEVSISEPAAADRLTLTTFEGQILNLRAADVSGVMALTPIPRSPIWPGARAALYVDGREFVVRATAESILSTIEAGIGLGPGVGVGVSGGAAEVLSIVTFEDRKAIGVNSGTATNGAWRTRDLNTEVDPDGLASLSANQITLAAGTYHVWAEASGYRVIHHQIRLRDITNAVTLLTGLSARSFSSDATTTISTLAGLITLAASTVLELQHRVSSTLADFGWGTDVGTGFDTNIHARIVFQKVA